jgi:hypothetical protein
MSNHCSREICKLCFNIIRVGFWVPNDIWKDVVIRNHGEETICLDCFTRIADEKQVEWDKEIQFFPVSFITHTERISNDG